MTKMNGRPTQAKWARAHELHTIHSHELDPLIRDCIRGIGDIAWSKKLTHPKLWNPNCSAAAAVFWLRGFLGGEALRDYFSNKGGLNFAPVPFTNAATNAAANIFLRVHDATEMAVGADELFSRLEEGLRQ